MSRILNLNGDDWKLSGWLKNQWRNQSMELNMVQKPAISIIKAHVPGAVQLDLIKAGLLSDPNYGLKSMSNEWVEHREWFYDKAFYMPEQSLEAKAYLCFEGLDYHGEIYLNGIKLSEFKGMFIPLEIEITGVVKINQVNHLRVVFYSPPEVDGQFGYSSKITTIKSRFNYVWDWCPRMVPVGIWDNVYIRFIKNIKITECFPSARIVDISENNGLISMSLNLDVHVPGQYRLHYSLSLNGMIKVEQDFYETLKPVSQWLKHQISVADIQLWYPNGYGEQHLYDINVEISKEGILCDDDQKRIGFRSIDFVCNKNAPQNALPYTLMVNDKRVFMSGVDWVPISPFYGGVIRDEYQRILTRFKEMNATILRVWGGAILEKHDFYDLCDELGLMVWQEFPQSSSGLDNTPSDDPQLLADLEQAASVFIKRRRHHACHVIWCGGNELMWENYTPINENHINIKMLKNLVEKMDHGKYFLPSSASGPSFGANEVDFGKHIHHDVHGPWNYMGDPDHYRFFNGDDSLLRSETGCPGSSRIETLEQYRESFPIWPPDETNPYWMHRGAWWIQLDQLSKLFGPWKNDGSETCGYVKASRYLQAEALRYAAESTRRREPEASGFIVWMGNEPFPNNANTSIIEYDGTPKPAFYWLKSAFSCLHASLKYSALCYKTDDIFNGEVYIHNHFSDDLSLAVQSEIFDVYGHVFLNRKKEINICQGVSAADVIQWRVTNIVYQTFFIQITISDHHRIVEKQTYLFTINGLHSLEPLRNLPTAHIEIERVNEQWILKNKSDVVATGIHIYGNCPKQNITADPNYLTLKPHDECTIMITGEYAVTRKDIIVDVFNS
ncbi:MAG: glycoside hydrolase family 2 TIM barrel-domain containing protein [Clostridiaceae bacterium]|nr:glycoside hydrolase family 2 TIM barrel-domain containing protein [Clostridiaceae bacterium]